MNNQFDYLIVCEDTAEDLCIAVTELMYSGYEVVGAPFVRDTDAVLFWYQAVERDLAPPPSH